MKRWPSMVAFVMLLTTWGLLQLLSHAETILAKRPFAQFPLAVGEHWQGKEFGLDKNILDVLRLTDYMMRGYVLKTDESAGMPVWLYVGYYESQRTGTTYHSPKNCLPGAGWQFVTTEKVTIDVQERKRDITINKVLIQKGIDRQLILYWYHDRGRVIASEYWAKAYMVWDAITQHRTDGSLVRVSVPVTTTPEESYQFALGFLREFWPLLQDFMPLGISETEA